MTTIAEASEAEVVQAVYNCYPCKFAKFNAVIHYRRYGVFPFNPHLN